MTVLGSHIYALISFPRRADDTAAAALIESKYFHLQPISFEFYPSVKNNIHHQNASYYKVMIGTIFSPIAAAYIHYIYITIHDM